MAIPLVWGAALGLLYIKTENAMLTTIIGLGILAALYQYSPQVFQSSADSSIFFWAIAIVAVAVGSTLYYLFKVKVQQP